MVNLRNKLFNKTINYLSKDSLYLPNINKCLIIKPLISHSSLLGLHLGLLLPAVLDRSSASLQEEAGGWDTLCWVRVHQKHLGPGHILREREAILLPCGDDQQWVHPGPPLGQYYQEYTVSWSYVVVQYEEYTVSCSNIVYNTRSIRSLGVIL